MKPSLDITHHLAADTGDLTDHVVSDETSIRVRELKKQQIAALRVLYKKAKEEPTFNMDELLDISTLVSANGRTRHNFPLPQEQKVSAILGIGLPKRCTEPKLKEIRYDKEIYHLVISAKNKDGEIKDYEIFIVEDKFGTYQLKTEQGLQIEKLRALYRRLREEPTYEMAEPLDLSLLIGAGGYAQQTFPLPKGKKIGIQLGLGLAKNLSYVYVTQADHLADSHIRLHLEGYKEDSATIQSTIIVSPDGIITNKAPSNSTDILKGYCLDRYVESLLAKSNIEASRNPRFYGSPFIGEAFVPNFISDKTAIHAKWGERGSEVFDYIRRYARLRESSSQVQNVLHIVASDTHLEDLQESIREFAQLRERPLAENVIPLADWAESVGLSKESVLQELALISAMAEVGSDTWLQQREYDMQLPNTTHSERLGYQGNHAQRIRELLEKDGGVSLVEILEQHKEIHSPYWERGYHILLAGCCSYLLERSLGEVQTSPHVEQKIEELAYELYPALKTYPDAWRILLDSTIIEQEDTFREGDGSKPSLLAFDLEKELQRLGAEKKIADKSQVVAIDIQSHAPQVHEKLWDALESNKGDLLRALKQINKATMSDDEKRDLRLESLRLVSSLLFDIHVAEKLPEPLEELKMNTQREASLLSVLSHLGPNTKLFYYFNKRNYTVSSGELVHLLNQTS